jgi:hypothetical protein
MRSTKVSSEPLPDSRLPPRPACRAVCDALPTTQPLTEGALTNGQAGSRLRKMGTVVVLAGRATRVP